MLGGLVDLARAARARLDAQVIAVTGSVGKTSTKEALRRVLGAQGETHASAASFNNHWGVPLSLARCPATVRFAIFEIGMNHAGEIEPLVADGAAAGRDHHHGRAGASGFLCRHRGDCRCQGGNLEGLEPGGAVVLNRDNSQFARLQRRARKLGISRIVSFGTNKKSDARLHRRIAACGLLGGARRYPRP